MISYQKTMIIGAKTKYLMLTMFAFALLVSFKTLGGSMNQYYQDKIDTVLNCRQKRIASLTSAKDVKLYQAEVRRKLARSFGQLPERTPLNAQVTGKIELDELLIDKVIFESRPGFYVSALFYRKKNISKPLPAILFLCGHSATGKSAPAYQEAPQYFAHQGFAVLSVDPYGQGERREFTGDKAIGPTSEHDLRGKQLLLTGDFFGTWRLWDAIRALDYLLTRQEVDPQRLGVTGTSGGGTMTTYLNAFDPRLTMAAPSCYITSLRYNFGNELPADAEQNPPFFLSQELDLADYIIASAPRPVMILAQDNDFFDIRGTREAYDELKKIYSLLGKPDNIRLHTGHGNHSYAPNHRVAAASFFGCTEEKPEPRLVVLSEKELYCAPDGSVFKIPGARKITDFIATKTITPPKVDTTPIEKLNYRVLRPEILRKDPFLYASRFHLERSMLKIVGTQVFYAPPLVTKVVLSLNGYDGTIPENKILCLLDVRGHGECAGTFFNGRSAENLYTRYANMLGEPYLEGKVKDVIMALQLLRQWGASHITLKADNEMAVIASYAAQWADAIEFNDTLPTFDQLAKENESSYPEWLFPFNVKLF